MGYTGNKTRISMGFTKSRGSLDSNFRDDVGDIMNNYVRFMNTIKQDVVPAAIVIALKPTLAKSKKYCPKNTGALAASAFLEEETFRNGTRAVIGYARDRSPDYAIIVHEMDYKHDDPTSKKFLQRALEEDQGIFMKRIAKAAKQNPANGSSLVRQEPIKPKAKLVAQPTANNSDPIEEARRKRLAEIRAKQERLGISSLLNIRRP